MGDNQVSRRKKRYKAKRLFFTGKYTSRQIAVMVDVTEATMSKWIQRYGWKNPDNAGLRMKVDVFSIIQPSFIDHLQHHNPALYSLVQGEIIIFMGIKKVNN